MELQEIITEAQYTLRKLGHHEDEGFYLPDLDNGFDLLRESLTKAFNAGKISAVDYLQKDPISTSFDPKTLKTISWEIDNDRFDSARTPESI